ncbi:DeoR/GlpR family DNA-binding transcription regulator [Paludifilum halophilum]|uniref:DeoR family transcriptional regulator n=1 Tax=Paludifilum halophilum TaxID=1642702 RepID=A0A235B4K1_9BACL|nr:DeoR/GlpR family DNA-binding transcription regulator [Paludifilum halophilum]OYD07152.1 DeoR family transcriptional regulator [Paludifilum halophilum]
MLAVERRHEIVAVVNREGSIRVTELAKRFQVTEETIRYDLKKLESKGKLLRSHGGAVTVKKDPEQEMPFQEREIKNVAEKKAIAREAVKKVEEGDTILLDASTTAWQMARLLPDMRLTVLTHSIKVAMELADHLHVRVISTGGALSPQSLSFIGPLAERSLEGYHVNKLFFSCGGADVQYGLSDSNEWQATLKHRMISIADYSYLLVDHSKFGVKAFKVFSDFRDLDEVITDDQTAPSVLKELEKTGLPVQTVSIAE